MYIQNNYVYRILTVFIMMGLRIVMVLLTVMGATCVDSTNYYSMTMHGISNVQQMFTLPATIIIIVLQGVPS